MLPHRCGDHACARSPYFIDVSEHRSRISQRTQRHRVLQVFFSARRRRCCATCGVACVRTRSIMRKRFNFFLASVIRMSVIAIPAGTDRHPSPLSSMARRAAWRRSERRRRRRRRKRARRRPSAGRRSNRSLLHSLRLRTTSVTASNGPAEVGVTSASLLHFDTPAPVDDRGRRRDKGSSLSRRFAGTARALRRERVAGPHLTGRRNSDGSRFLALADALGVLWDGVPCRRPPVGLQPTLIRRH
jgi:catechol 2,3-dioxygenase-like lactoylglutathione lyase family enzyme